MGDRGGYLLATPGDAPGRLGRLLDLGRSLGLVSWGSRCGGSTTSGGFAVATPVPGTLVPGLRQPRDGL